MTMTWRSCSPTSTSPDRSGDDVDRYLADDADDLDSLAQAIGSIPERERAAIARSVFERLPSEQQWSVLDRAFSDEEMRRYLAEEHAERLAALRRSSETLGFARAAAESGRLDVTDLPPGMTLTIGLFRPVDVGAALERGASSAVCARRVELRASDDPGRLRVIDDQFNPGRALFVTAEYDDAVWRSERLASHSTVRVGSSSDGDGTFEPVLYLGARVDTEVGGELRRGRLHLGYALVGDRDVFGGRS